MVISNFSKSNILLNETLVNYILIDKNSTLFVICFSNFCASQLVLHPWTAMRCGGGTPTPPAESTWSSPRGEFEPFPIYCEMDQEGHGWTLFQRRVDGSEDFNRDWRDYARGFGNVSGEFWLGNEFLHHLSTQYHYLLRVEVTDWFNRKYIAEYAGFEVDSKRNDFRLTVEEFLGGNATDALTYHSGSKFTTTDKDNDESDGVNCASVHHGGWWFQACDRANLNGLYYREGTYNGEWDDGIEWKERDGPPFYSFKTTKMMLRPWD